ncbi:hypothetical protein D918_07271 [Trichuris suis]|nr:hypothetical protein D918_07271 [Trichuris suis]
MLVTLAFALTGLGLFQAGYGEILSDIPDTKAKSFVLLLNDERVKSKAAAENMGCMTWDKEMVNIAKTAQTECIVNSYADSVHGFILMPSSDSILDYPRTWATQDSDFDYENMTCKQSTKQCKDFMQAMYYKRGKIGCVECHGIFNAIICAFEHKVPEGGLPNRKGTAISKCEQGEHVSYQKCCAAESKNKTEPDVHENANLVPLYRYIDLRSGNTILKLTRNFERDQLYYGIFGKVAQSKEGVNACTSLVELIEWSRGRNRIYATINDKPNAAWKKGASLGYVATAEGQCGANLLAHLFFVWWNGRFRFYTTNPIEVYSNFPMFYYVSSPFALWNI